MDYDWTRFIYLKSAKRGNSSVTFQHLEVASVHGCVGLTVSLLDVCPYFIFVFIW